LSCVSIHPLFFTQDSNRLIQPEISSTKGLTLRFPFFGGRWTIIKPTVEQMRSTLVRLGHLVFVDGELNLNVVGIRKDYSASNRFDDTLCLFAKEGGQWFICHYPCTIDPG